MINSQSNTKQKGAKISPTESLQGQEEEIKMLIDNIESQNVVLDKLTLAIESSMGQKQINTDKKQKNKTMKRKFMLWLIAFLMASVLWETQLYAIPVKDGLKWENSQKTPLKSEASYFIESFESSTFPPTGWKLESTRTSSTKQNWRLNTTVPAHTGSNTAISPDGLASAGSNMLIIPTPNLTNLTNPIFSFYYKNQFGSSLANQGQFLIHTSTDGITYTQIGTFATATKDKWRNYQKFIGKDVKYVKIELKVSAGQEDHPTYIDDIYIGEITEALCVTPQNVLCSDSTFTSLTLDWEELGNSNASWQINYATTSFVDEDESMSMLTCTEHPYTITGLDRAATYHFRIRTICANGDTSAWTPYFSKKPNQYVCTNPSSVLTPEITHNKIVFTWSETDSEKYIVQLRLYDSATKEVSVIETFSTTNLTYTFTNLLPNRLYIPAVRSFCSVGDSSTWNSKETRTLSNCPQPTNLIISEKTSTGLTLGWTPAGTESKWDLSIVEGSVQVPSNPPTPYIESSAASYTFSSLKSNTNYVIYLRANCATTDQSAWVNVETTTPSLALTEINEGFEGDLSTWELSYQVTGSDLSGAYGPGGKLSPPKEGRQALAFPFMMEATTRTAITPELDLSALETPTLKFFYQRITLSGNMSDASTIFVKCYESVDKSTWVLIEGSSESLVGTNITWTEQSVVLKKTTKYVKIEVSCSESAFNAFAIDELSIKEKANPPVEALTEINEGFEGEPCLPATWTTVDVNVDPSGLFAWACDSNNKNSGLRSLHFTSLTKQGPKEGSIGLLLPELNLSGVENPIISFFWKMVDFSGDATPAIDRGGMSFEIYTSTTTSEAAAFTKLGEKTTGGSVPFVEYKAALTKEVKYIKINVISQQQPAMFYIDDFTVGAPAVPPIEAVASISEGFEGDFPPVNWTLESNRTDASKDWRKNTTSSTHNGSGTAESLNSTDAASNTLILPPLNLSALNNPILSFYYKNETPQSGNQSFIYIHTSTDGITYTAGLRINTATAGQWTNYQEVIGQGVKFIKIEHKTDRGDAKITYIDDIYVGEITDQICVSPKNVIFTDSNYTSLTLDWEALGNPSANWQIHYGTTQYDYQIVDHPNSKMLTCTTHPYTLEGLNKDTLYHFRMRTVCAKDTSAWTPYLSKKPNKFISCHTPTNLVSSQITQNSFILGWKRVAEETQFIIELYSNDLLLQTVQVNAFLYQFKELSANTSYLVRIRSFCGENDSSEWTSLNIRTACRLFTEASLPWSTDFEAISVANQFPDCMEYTKHDYTPYNYPIGTFVENSDAWFAHSGSKGARFYAGEGNSNKNDDYLFTPAFELKAGHNYRFSFYYAISSTNPTNIYNLEAKMGTVQSKEGMTIRIGDSLVLQDFSNRDYKQYIANFTPAADGNYYLGIHALTPDFNAVGLNIDDITVERILTCDHPTDVILTSIAATTAKFTWKSAATQWEIRYAKMNAEEFTGTVTTLMMLANATAEFTISNLLPETLYGFQVRAICAEDDSSAWTVIKKFTTQPTCPKPTQLVISEQTTTGFKLAWTPKGTESKWDLSIVEGRVANPVTPYITSEAANYTFANLNPNRYYTIHLRANCATTDQSYWVMDTVATLCGAEALPYTEGFERIIKDEELPLCVTTTSSTVVRTKRTSMGYTLRPRTGDAFIYYIAGSNDYIYTPAFNLKAGHEYEFSAWWIANDTIDKLSLQYGTERNTDMNSFAEVIYKASKDDYIEIKGRFTPTTDGVHYLAVYAQSGDGTLSIDDLSLKEVFTCAKPTALKTLDITSQAARLQWTATTDSFSLSYRIKDSEAPYTTINTKTPTYTVSGLLSDTTYTWKVQSVCSFGNSEEVTGPNFSTLEVLCEMPTQTQTSDITYDQAKFAWTSEGSTFEVRFKGSADTSYRTEIVNAKTFVAISLKSTTNYTWSVRNVCNETQKSEWTTPLVFTTLGEPCATPIALNTDNITGTEATLTWASSASDFQVRYRKTSETTYTTQNVKVKTLTINNLAPKTAYIWEVRAICAAKDTSAWADDKFTTEALSIEDEQGNLVRVYSNHANIYIQNPGQIYFQTIEVVNVSGQVIRTHPATNNTNIEIADIKTTGIYILRLLSKNGLQSHKIIVK